MGDVGERRLTYVAAAAQAKSLRHGELEPQAVRGRLSVGVGCGGRDESVRRGAGSQRIVAARPLCRLQCPVAYLSRLQRIQPAAREEGSFEAAGRGSSAGPAWPVARALGGAERP